MLNPGAMLKHKAVSTRGLIAAITGLPILVILWGLAILHTVLLARSLPQRTYAHDFSVFYTSAIAFRRGLDPYTANLAPIGERIGMHVGSLIHTTDTPTALLFVIPFSFATPDAAHTIWTALNGAALVAALVLLLRPKYSRLNLTTALTIAALALVYAPVTVNFIFGQRQPLVLLLLVLVMRELAEGREAGAGLLLGVAIAYRAFPIVIAGYFVIRRQWRPLAFTGIGLAVAGVVTVAGLGIPVSVSYLHGMRFAITGFRLDPANVSIRGFLIRMFSYLDGYQLDDRMLLLQNITIVTAQIVTVLLVAWPTYQRRDLEGFDRRSYGLWIVAAIALSPLSWIHYMTLLLIPFVEIAGAAARQKCSRWTLWTAIASYVLTAVTYDLREDVVGALSWAHGVKYLAEGSSAALLLAFLAVYWFATERSDATVPSPRTVLAG
jgi:alpha-1,2-mannosyltransferase